MIIDADQNVFALASNGQTNYETVFGPASGQLNRYIHRDGDDPNFNQSFTIAGQPPSELDAFNLPDSLSYNLTVDADGQRINDSIANTLEMTFATTNDVAAISLADIAGDWTATTSVGAANASLILSMTFAADGAVSGDTDFNFGGPTVLSGNAAAASGSNQYLTVSFTWAEKNRTGVIYRDRNDSTQLILNTFGARDASAGGTESFSARLVR